MTRSLLATLCLLASTCDVRADPGHPVAIRQWGQSMVSIETYWNLRVVIDPYAAAVEAWEEQLSADLVLLTRGNRTDSGIDAFRSTQLVVTALNDAGEVQPVQGALDRAPNEPQARWRLNTANDRLTDNAVRVTALATVLDSPAASEQSAQTVLVVDVDGVRIVHCPSHAQAELVNERAAALGRVDVLTLPIDDPALDDEETAAVIKQLRPRLIIALRRVGSPRDTQAEAVASFAKRLGQPANVVRAVGNTAAISATRSPAHPGKIRIILLGNEPWQPKGELVQLLEQKDSECVRSEAVFAKLSTRQMNFRPANGTHTPRWNAEHMMGRELLFFTRAFAERDSAFTPLDLNPEQMPPDYQPAHSDWTGTEEARQMGRVRALVARFAYLLADVGLDERAWQDGWKLRFLLERMIEHYREHTNNVLKKFNLPDWPAN